MAKAGLAGIKLEGAWHLMDVNLLFVCLVLLFDHILLSEVTYV